MNVLVFMLCASTALVQTAPGADAPSQPAAATPENAATTAAPAHTTTTAQAPPSQPGVVVHTSAETRGDARDQRVEIGGMRISMPSWAQDTPAQNPTQDPSSSSRATVRSDGAIVIPSNTLGPGESLWRVREREDTERRLARAHAERAEALNDHVENRRYEPSRGYRYGSGVFGYGYLHGGSLLDDGYPRGPVTTTITRFNDLGSEAQRNFADAAQPRGLFEAQEARDRALSQFGRDSMPQIIQSQNARDRAFGDANRNTFAPGPTTTEVVKPK